MKKALLFILTFVLINQYSISQFKEGYILKNNNDSIFGYINFEGSINNSMRCEFKELPEGESQVFKPGDIKAFRFTDGKYFSTMEIQVDNKPKTVFIEWLIKGRASLLTYSASAADIRYFMLHEDGSFVELTNTPQKYLQEGIEYERMKQEYINILSFYFRDCPPLQPKIENVKFNSNALLKVTKEYHELTCKTEDCIVFEDKTRKAILDWGIYTAFLNSKTILNSDLPENVYPTNTFGLGLALNISNLPALYPKFSAKISMVFFSALFRYDTTDAWSLISDDRICSIIYTRVPIQLTYKFTQKKFNPYLSIGPTVNIRFSYKQYDQYLTDWITRSRPINSYDSGISPFQFGINTGFGFEYLVSKGFTLNFGYDFEICPQFFGTYVDDHSRNINNIVYLRGYFKSKKKRL